MTGPTEEEWLALKAELAQARPATPTQPKPVAEGKPRGYDVTGFPGFSLLLLAVACWPVGVWQGVTRWIAEGIWLLILAGIIAGKRGNKT
jgi:hypothetical protein